MELIVEADIHAANRAQGMPSCPVPVPPVGSSALLASGTNRSTRGTSAITRRYHAVITENPPVNSALGRTSLLCTS